MILAPCALSQNTPFISCLTHFSFFVVERIKYLTQKGLTIEEIKELASRNPKVLTNDISYFEMMEEKYTELGFDKRMLKQLLVSFDRALTIEPVMISSDLFHL